MLIWTTVKVALRSLLANKLRSFLAVLGIIIGVAAVISMLALGAGAQERIMQGIEAMGTNLLVVRPGQRGSRGVQSGDLQELTLDDAKALLQEVSGAARLSPVVNGNSQAKHLNRNTRTSVLGAAATYFSIRNFEVESGRPFSEREAESGARVAVLGATTATDLFGWDDPVGDQIKLQGINFQVVGVLKAKGDQGWFNPDDQVLVPYTTAMKQLFGVASLREIDIQCDEMAPLADVENEVSAVLRRRHRIRPGQEDDFSVRNQAEILETASTVSGTFKALLAGIASISLLVGGIGIMNVMLVTVTERTREIGIRKAIGARDRDILRQFLLEAVVMTALGGILGIVLGVGGARLAASLSGYSARVELASVLMALGFSGAVGLFFGYYPASRAARLDPIEALRYE